MFNVWVQAGEDCREICMQTGFPLHFSFRIVGRKHQKIKCDISSASYRNLHGFVTRFLFIKQLAPGRKKQLFVTFSLIGPINLSDPMKAAKHKRNFDSVTQLQGSAWDWGSPCPQPQDLSLYFIQLRIGQVFHLTTLSSSQSDEWCHQGTRELQSPYGSCLWSLYKLLDLARDDVFPLLKCCQWHGTIWSNAQSLM